MEEGSLHGALTIEGVKKLPPRAGRLYRGMRLTEAEFQDLFFGNLPVPDETLRQLTSFATEEPEERGSLPMAKEIQQTPWKIVSVMMYVDVHTGRDIGDLSVFGHKEKEWLLLPGATLVTDSVDVFNSIEESGDGNLGVPSASQVGTRRPSPEVGVESRRRAGPASGS